MEPEIALGMAAVDLSPNSFRRGASVAGDGATPRLLVEGFLS